MYKALYRKYRPLLFEDVVGQEQITRTLKNEVLSGRVAHAYLFTGSRGTGKTTCSKILAMAVNCLNPKDGDPCLECENCLGIQEGSILDVAEIDAASNNGVDNIRDLRQEANFTPANGKKRVYIIDEAHMLSAGAFNALLKIMEEPPEHVMFILATTEVHKIPATILSRCQRFDFRRIRPADIADRLQLIAQKEQIALEKPAAELIARISDGGMRDAISLLDQCAAQHEKIDLDAVSRTAGIADRSYLSHFARAILQNDAARCLQLVEELYQQSKDLQRLCEELVEHFRDLMVFLAAKGGLEDLLPGELEPLQQEAQLASLDRVLSVLSLLQTVLERMYQSGNQKIELEMGLIRLCTAPAAPSVPPASQGSAPTASTAPVRPAPVSPAPESSAAPFVPESPPLPEPPPAEMIPEPPVRQESGEVWPQILEKLRQMNPVLYSILAGSGASVQDDILCVYSDKAFLRELLKKDNNKSSLVSAAQAVTGKVYRVALPRPEQQTAPAQDDTLDRFEKQARDAGIDITIK